MWRITTQRLLLATSCVGVGIAALMIDTKEPYGIMVASLAFVQAVFCFLDPRWRVVRSERLQVVVMVLLLCGFLVALGIVFAILGR